MTPDASEPSPELGLAILLACLREFPEVHLTVRGACMAPAVCDGDVVTLVQTSRQPPRPGDVVLARVAGGFRLHRLLWAPRRGPWRIKADGAPTWDAALPHADVIATAVEVTTGGRARGTRSARRWARSLIAVAGAHLRVLVRPRPAV